MSLQRAFRKGRQAFDRGDGREACPYPDHRKINDSKRPLPLRREWLKGFDQAQAEHTRSSQ